VLARIALGIVKGLDHFAASLPARFRRIGELAVSGNAEPPGRKPRLRR